VFVTSELALVPLVVGGPVADEHPAIINGMSNREVRRFDQTT
jgi:hypothetical protein